MELAREKAFPFMDLLQELRDKVYAILIPREFVVTLKTSRSDSTHRSGANHFIATPKTCPKVIQLSAVHNVDKRIRHELLEVLWITPVVLHLDRRMESDAADIPDAEELHQGSPTARPAELEAMRGITNIIKAYGPVAEANIIHVQGLDMIRAPCPDRQRHLYLTRVTLYSKLLSRGLPTPQYDSTYVPIILKCLERSPNFNKSHDHAAEIEMGRRVFGPHIGEEFGNLKSASNLLRLCKSIGSPDGAYIQRGLDSFQLLSGQEAKSIWRDAISKVTWDSGYIPDELLRLV